MNRLETLHPREWSSLWPSYSNNLCNSLYVGNWPYYPATYGLEVIWRTLSHGLLSYGVTNSIREDLR